MQRIIRRTTAAVLSAALLAGSAMAVQSSGKTSVRAESSVKTLMFDEKGIVSGYNTKDAATVYFGVYAGKPISWRVVGYNGKGVAASANSSKITLLSSTCLGEGEWFRPRQSDGNAYQGSDVQKYINMMYDVDFSKIETLSISGRALKVMSYTGVSPFSDGISGTAVSDAKLWALSTQEAYFLDESIRKTGKEYWLRTPGDESNKAAFVRENGNYSFFGDKVDVLKYLRPAMNVDPSTILFSTANGLKSNSVSSVGKMTKITDYSKNEWKLTVLDKSRSDFNVSLIGSNELSAGDDLSIAFGNAVVGTEAAPEFVSVLFTDTNDDPLYYGHIACNVKNGAGSFTIPADVKSGKYRVYIFNEKCNGDNKTDYSSKLKCITIKIENPGKVKGLKAVNAGKNKVKISWNAVAGAEGYLIYGQKNGVYGYVGMTTRGTTFTDVNALDTDYNYYWVFAFITDEGGRRIPGKCEKYVFAKGVCVAVTGLSASSGAGYVKLSWNAVADADGYLIYGIRPGGEYGYIGMTTTGTTFTDRNASTSNYTYYWVYPYHLNNGKMIPGGTANYTYGKAR